MVSHGEKQNVSADELLQALADGLDIQLNQCTITGALDINRFFDAGGCLMALFVVCLAKRFSRG